MSKITDEIAKIAANVAFETEKFEGGNSSAAIRARKGLQEIKKLCTQGRDEIQEKRNKAA